MKLVFTKNDLPVSKLIRWGLNEPVSHFGIVYGNLIFHINFLGAHIEYYPTFEKHNEIVFEIESKMPLHEAKALFWEIIASYDGTSYDFTGFLYFGWRGILYRFFHIPLPEKNKWQNPAAHLCVQLAKHLPEKYFRGISKIPDHEAVSPYKLFLAIWQVVRQDFL